MCLFIHVLLPKDADMSGLAPLIEKNKLKLERMECTEAISNLRPDDLCYLPRLHPMCHCATDLGRWKGREETIEKIRELVENESRRREEAKFESEWTRFKRRFVRHGDGFQAFTSYVETLKEIDEGKELVEIGENKDLDQWMGFIGESLTKSLTEHVGVILHWAIGADTRPKAIESVRRIPLREMTERALLYMEKEVLYEFVQE